jgi:hypothetical protein
VYRLHLVALRLCQLDPSEHSAHAGATHLVAALATLTLAATNLALTLRIRRGLLCSRLAGGHEGQRGTENDDVLPDH